MSLLHRGLSAGKRRVADPNGDLVTLIHAIKNELVERLDRLTGEADSLQRSVDDQLAIYSSQLTTLSAESTAIRSELAFARASIESEIETAAPGIRLQKLTGARIEAIDTTAAEFLNYCNSHRGPLSDVGVWINHPVVVEWSQASASVSAVNERIVEHPYTFAALSALEPGSAILDIGGGESTMALSLASMGHKVTVIEPQGYPFSHPNLTVFEQPLESFPAEQVFDAVVLLSTIEHFGIGAYRGNPEAADTADFDAMALVKKLIKDDGILVVTTPYGAAAQNELERTYDFDRLQRLMSGWTIAQATVVVRVDPLTWTVEATELAPPAGDGRVVMLTAHPDVA